MTMRTKDKLIGYLGVLPDMLYLDDEPVKWSWLTCWWASPNHKGVGIGQDILKSIYEQCNGLVGCSEFTELGQKAADKSGLFNVIEIPGMLYHFGRRQGNDATSVEHQLISWSEQSNWNPEQWLEYINEIDEETHDFILKNGHGELTRRSKEELDWILRYSWVLEAPFDDLTSTKFFFSTVSRRFSYYALKIFGNDGQLVGFIMLRLRDTELQIPYFYCLDESSCLKRVCEVVLFHLIKLNVEKLKTFNQRLIKGLESMDFPVTSSEHQVRKCYISKKVSIERVRKMMIQDGDGDNTFT
jgi:hypothetical protein